MIDLVNLESFDGIKVAALAGGVGGAKLADGLSRIVPSGNLTVIVNPGDDFHHLGLKICPDLDTVFYTLAGIANPETGWGQAEESWHALETIARLGGPGWFRLGDRDLGLHLERTRRLEAGQALSQVVFDFCCAFGIQTRILPATDDPMPTMVLTRQGELLFQEYFVHQRCQPEVTGFRFVGAEHARPAPGVLEALKAADLVVICPSNPWVSIAPILAVPGLQAVIETRPVLGVSPIIGGKAVKGPAAKMYSELGLEPAALTVAQHYGSLVDGFAIDTCDAGQAAKIREQGVSTLVTDILMKTPEDRTRLAGEVVQFGLRWIHRANPEVI